MPANWTLPGMPAPAALKARIEGIETALEGAPMAEAIMALTTLLAAGIADVDRRRPGAAGVLLATVERDLRLKVGAVQAKYRAQQ